MIDIIDAQLCVWGKRQFTSMRSGRGFPPYSPMFRDTPPGKGDGGNPPKGVALTGAQEMRDIDTAVRLLSPEPRRLVAETYVIGGNRNHVAMRLGLSRQRYYERLHAIHVFLQSAMHEFGDESSDCPAA